MQHGLQGITRPAYVENRKENVVSNTMLIIGSPNYSSWSFRAWLAVKLSRITFELQKIDLDKPETKARLIAETPAQKVPVLHDEGHVIWDSLAIGLYLAEQFPHMLPKHSKARAEALSVICEMHSGFSALRERCSMEMIAKHKYYVRSAALDGEIKRIQAIWGQCRANHGNKGPFLMGDYSLVDAFFAPVVSRFVTYDIQVDEIAQCYMATVVAEPMYQAWFAMAERDERDRCTAFAR